MRSLSVVVLGMLVGLSGCAGSPGAADGSSAAAQSNEAITAAAPIKNFHVVHDGLYRGARPDDKGLAYLQSIGVNTIIDLETTGWFEPTSDSDISHEKSQAESLGMTWIAKPMSSFLPVNGNRVDEIMAILADPANGNVFVHCAHGQDRTGLIVGLERVEQEYWAPKDAYDEMKQDGFHSILENLNHYYEERTGYEG